MINQAVISETSRDKNHFMYFFQRSLDPGEIEHYIDRLSSVHHVVHCLLSEYPFSGIEINHLHKF